MITPDKPFADLKDELIAIERNMTLEIGQINSGFKSTLEKWQSKFSEILIKYICIYAIKHYQKVPPPTAATCSMAINRWIINVPQQSIYSLDLTKRIDEAEAFSNCSTGVQGNGN